MRPRNRSTHQSSPRGHTRQPIRRPVSFLARIVAQCLFPTVSEPSHLGRIDGLAQNFVMGERSAEAQEESAEEKCQPLTRIRDLNDCSVMRGQSMPIREGPCEEEGYGQTGRMTIDTLPDDALLEIFTHYLLEDYAEYTETWHTLVHVCRRWRNIVFESPRRLNLRIRCTSRTPVTEMPNVWLVLPIVIRDNFLKRSSFMGGHGADNIVAALELKDRVHSISLWNYPRPHLKRFAAAMLGPFPALTSLEIVSAVTDELDEAMGPMPVTAFSEEFLSGSAPRLRSFFLKGTPFPGIQRLLLSIHHLVSLTIRDIPHSGYISPEVIVTCLSAMPNLKRFWLGFRSCASMPPQSSQRPRPLTRAVLPTLTEFGFEGASQYIEDLLHRIDTPLLYTVYIDLFYLHIFDTPQLHSFLARTQTFKSGGRGAVEFYDEYVYLRLGHGYQFCLGISFVSFSGQLSSLAQICRSSFPPICTLECLHIRVGGFSLFPFPRKLDGETTQWVELLSPFTALKYLFLDDHFAQPIAHALRLSESQLAVEGATQVLPALQYIFIQGLSGPIQEVIGDYVTARNLSGLPVAVHSWDGQVGM